MNDCPHSEYKVILTPSGPHYGKRICRECGRFCGWEAKHETVARQALVASRILALGKIESLTQWEKDFHKTLSETGPKFSPKQMEQLDRLAAKYSL